MRWTFVVVAAVATLLAGRDAASAAAVDPKLSTVNTANAPDVARELNLDLDNKLEVVSTWLSCCAQLGVCAAVFTLAAKLTYSKK